jgi:outer membrane protein OmpA-like peptidoglycan-associated protein
LGLAALVLLGLWLWSRNRIVQDSFNAAEQVRIATQKADAALAALKPGFGVADLTSALNLQIMNFASGSAEIPGNSLDFLNRAAVAIKMAPSGTVIEIGGHTDNTGDAASNLQLSQQRADSVRDYLVRQGVDSSVLTAKGYGDARPVASNDTEEGKFRNRRIEFNVVR